jgi:hypothetical protein
MAPDPSKRLINLPEERFVPADGIHYLEFLEQLHLKSSPKWYFEIGTNKGKSLELSKCRSIAVDPRFVLNVDVVGKKDFLALIQLPSDEAFESGILDGFAAKFDIAFLDGLHLVEYLLRDIINCERYMAEDGVMLLHDTRPFNLMSAERTPPGGAWAGDVWKILPILAEFRPDLRITHLDCKPTGLTLVQGPWGGSASLSNSYNEIIDRFVTMTIDDYGPERLAADFPLVASDRALLDLLAR